MLALLSEVKFLTTRDDINIKDTDFGAFKYHDKRVVSNNQHPYGEGKQNYAELRNQHYALDGKKPKKIRNSIRKLEEQLKHNRIVYCAWSDNVVLQMLLSNGLLVHICINIFTGDIIRMAFDRFFVGKLVSDAVTDAIITRMHIIIAYNENQLTFVYLQKPSLKRSAPEKISRMDPKIFNIIINGPQTRKIARQLACNNSYDLLVVWTKSSQNEVFPWRPTLRDQDRANVHIYKFSRNKLDLLCYYWTENDPINVEFSRMNHNQLRSVEQKISRKGEVTIEICVYELNKSKIHRASITSIPLQSQVCCHSFSPDNEKLMLGCIDGSVVLFDEGRGITHLIKAAFIPTLVTWHADSAIVIVANEKCQIQCFDISLACLRNQLISEDMTPASVLDLSSYFAAQPSLLKLCCSKKPDLTQYNEKFIQTDSFILLLFENGPMATLRLLGGNGLKGDVHTSGFTADVLIHQYLKLNNVEKAINVLLCLNWDSYGAMCLMSLNKISNFIFKQPLMPEREIQLQKALGSFHVPVKPLCEETELEFGDQVRDITRKFFQYLLRYRSYEKAFNLAIDINDEDLFMDLYNCAKTDGVLDLATDAYRKAEDLLARTDSRTGSHSTCSRDSCSVCDSSASEEVNTKTWKETSNKSKNVPVSRTKTNGDGTIERRGKSAEDTIDARHPRTTKYRKNAKTSNSSQSHSNSLSKIRIPKPELKATSTPINSTRSERSKSPMNGSAMGSTISMPAAGNSVKTMPRSASQMDLNYPPSTNHRKPKLMSQNSFSTDYVNEINSGEPIQLKYQPQTIEKVPRPLPRLPMSSPQSLQSHHEIAPKSLTRSQTLDWDVPDQTIGIPLTNPTPILDLHHYSMPPMQDSSYINNYPFRPNVMHSTHLQSAHLYHPKPLPLIKSKSMFSIPTNAPPIIHHPLVSGNIPPSFHSPESYQLKKHIVPMNQSSGAPPPPPKPNNRPNVSNASILTTTQQNMSPKKESGEKNKVKFSDTVTVAVVPEIPRKDKNLIERMKRTNGFHPIGITDPRRELADSLPLCHPNDDYLKDFTPMNVHDDQQPSTSSNVQEGVLTWV